MLALHLLQLCLVYINTLMIQQVLAEPAWAGRLNAQDLRGITPLIYSHVNPYGSFLLDLHSRLPIDPPRLALSPSAPKCCSATITSSGEGYFAAPDTNVDTGGEFTRPLGTEELRSENILSSREAFRLSRMRFSTS